MVVGRRILEHTIGGAAEFGLLESQNTYIEREAIESTVAMVFIGRGGRAADAMLQSWEEGGS